MNPTTGEYELNPEPQAVGSNNPQLSPNPPRQPRPNPVFATMYGAGEDSNMVVGIVSDAHGCRNSDTVRLQLVPIPNTIIPNDPFFVMNRVFLPDFDIEIWDTWGLKIKDYGTKGWDGTYRDRVVRSGTYYYNAKIPTLDGVTIISGAITVLQDGERP
jgi:gliding motility-associated-like protein